MGSNNRKKKKKKERGIASGQGASAPLCLWRCFWFPASNCGLGMVGALIRHRWGLAEVAREPVGSSPYLITASCMSYMEKNCVCWWGRQRRGLQNTPRDAVLLWPSSLTDPALPGIQPRAFCTGSGAEDGLLQRMGWPRALSMTGESKNSL